GVEIGGCALVEVEVAGGRVDRALHEGAHRLILQLVLLAVEIVDGIRRALLQAPEQCVKGESPHTGRKLPWPGVERKPTALRMPARRGQSRQGPGAPGTRSRAGPHRPVVASATGPVRERAPKPAKLARGGDQTVPKLRIALEEFGARHGGNLLPSGQA